MSFEQDVRTMLRDRAEGVVAAPVIPDRTVRRVRVRKALMAGGVAAAVAAVAVAGVFMRSAIWTDAAPVPPAEEGKQEIEPMRNGRIITSVNGMKEWQAFDQDTGFFFFFTYWNDRASVIRQDGPAAKFDCRPNVDCEIASFGPGPDELTVPLTQSDVGSLLVIAFDGTVRRTLDISPVVTQNARIIDFAWSPDRSRLAISTEPDCDSSDPCEGKVWIVEPDGGEPQLVFTERGSDEADELYGNGTVLGELAWSPDGRSLTLLVASFFPKGYENNGVWPRLVALRLQPGQPVRAETLHVYDDVDMPEATIAWEWSFYFAYAWSPDGTRIAVTSKGGITEISAEDGHVLARHQGKGGYGLLAWLPKP
jgi:hypothetical protein